MTMWDVERGQIARIIKLVAPVELDQGHGGRSVVLLTGFAPGATPLPASEMPGKAETAACPISKTGA